MISFISSLCKTEFFMEWQFKGEFNTIWMRSLRQLHMVFNLFCHFKEVLR